MWEGINVLTRDYREMIRPRGSHRIQNSIEGFMSLKLLRKLLTLSTCSSRRESKAKLGVVVVSFESIIIHFILI